MKAEAIPTRGKPLGHAAFVYEFFELLLTGKKTDYDRDIAPLLKLKESDRMLGLGSMPLT